MDIRSFTSVTSEIALFIEFVLCPFWMIRSLDILVISFCLFSFLFIILAFITLMINSTYDDGHFLYGLVSGK